MKIILGSISMISIDNLAAVVATPLVTDVLYI